MTICFWIYYVLHNSTSISVSLISSPFQIFSVLFSLCARLNGSLLASFPVQIIHHHLISLSFISCRTLKTIGFNNNWNKLTVIRLLNVVFLVYFLLHYGSCLSVFPSVRPSVCLFVRRSRTSVYLTLEQKRVKKSKICMHVPQGWSNRGANFQLRRSTVRVTVRLRAAQL